MTELVLDTSALSSYLANTLRAKKVKVSEKNQIIIISPADDVPDKQYSCPFLGIAADSTLTVDKFMAWKREERDAEYEKELHS